MHVYMNITACGEFSWGSLMVDQNISAHVIHMDLVNERNIPLFTV